MLGLLAETPIHPGVGQSLGGIDLPVAREAATDYPVLVGSSLKGALKDLAEQVGLAEIKTIFGSEHRAGEVLVSDARLLLLPVRSLTSSYRWVTSPHLVERLVRDLTRGHLGPELSSPRVARGKALASGQGSLFLEERQFDVSGPVPDGLVEVLGILIHHDQVRARLSQQVVVLNDDDMSWFCRYGLAVQARNVLDDGKMSKNLWYEETLPPDTLMYALVMGRTRLAMTGLLSLFPDGGPYLQAGGNETVGQGWFAVAMLDR